MGLLAAAALSLPLVSRAADHIDSPSAIMDPPADITDVYAWMDPTATKLNLILNVHPFASASSAFSDSVVYTFRVTSMASYDALAANKAETLIRCKFYTAKMLECWVGPATGASTAYVTGDASNTAGITSSDNKVKVFAGLRNDPFFFELNGFTETVKKVVMAAPMLTFDANKCPALDATTSALLVNQLKSNSSISAMTPATPAKDFFAAVNVMSLAIQLDKTLVNSKGDVLSVWASTHKLQ